MRGLYFSVTQMVSVVLAVLLGDVSLPELLSLLPTVGQEQSSPLLLKLHDFDMFSYFILKLPERELEFRLSPRLLKLKNNNYELQLKCFHYNFYLLDRDPFSLFRLLADLCKYLLSLEFDLLILGRFCIDSALKDNPAIPTRKR